MDSNVSNTLDSNVHDRNRKLPLVFLISLFLILLPLIILGFATGNVDWGGFDISDGLVFTATVGVLSRIFIKTGIKVGIRTGVRSGLRTGIRSTLRGGVRSVLGGKKPDSTSSWLTRWIFVSPIDYKEQ